MIPRSTVPCDACNSRGVIPHQKRTVEDGKADPFDHQVEELCMKCGGSGRMAAPPPSEG